MKSRARATATGVSVGLTIGTLVWACTSLPEITAIPTDAGAVGPEGGAFDAGGLSTECQAFLSTTGLTGRLAFGPVAGSAVTYLEAADGTPEIAWVGKCNGATEPTVYRTPLGRFAPSKDAITQFPAGDLCVGATQFGPPIVVPQFEDIITLVPSDRNPKFLCALVAGNGNIAPPYGPSKVHCFGSDPKAMVPERIEGNFIGLFRSKEFGPATIRAAFGGSANAEVNTFVASEANGTVVFSPIVKLTQKVPAGSTMAIASTGASNEDSFTLFDEGTNVLAKFAADGTNPSSFGTPGNVPKPSTWGEAVFADTAGTVLVAGLEGPMDGRLRPRVSVVLPKGNALYRAVTDLTTREGATSYGLASGGFERLVLVPGTDKAGTGAAIVAVRGMDNNNAPISAFVLAKAGTTDALLPSETNGIRILALPTRYGLAGSIPTDTKQKASIYVGISASAMKDWSNDRCTSGMVAAIQP